MPCRTGKGWDKRGWDATNLFVECVTGNVRIRVDNEMIRNLAGLVAVVLLVSSCDMDSGKIDLSENQARPMAKATTQAPCRDNNPLRNAYFGDFHVHTGYSSDGWLFDVRATPQDAYRYAFGGEYFAEGRFCTDKQLPEYQSEYCQEYRQG